MQTSLLIKIRQNPNLYRYLRENSYWYKNLNRDPSSIKKLEEEMKKKYKLTTADRINNIAQNLELVRTFMEVMK